MKRKVSKLDQDGFTIIELMIALSIFAVILVISTLVMIQISSIYVKGVNASSLQETSRNIMSNISSDIEFSGSTPLGCTETPASDTCYTGESTATYGPNDEHLYAICVGNVRYTYLMDTEEGYDTANGYTADNVLWRDNISGSETTCPPLDIEANPVMPDALSTDTLSNGDSGGYEMVPDHMRLTRFLVMADASTNDIYNISVWLAYGSSDLLLPESPDGQTACRGNLNGDQYCAITEANTSIAGRVY
jgi:prepilin-type N-terminal cleavage/methylation domain-containing protein